MEVLFIFQRVFRVSQEPKLSFSFHLRLLFPLTMACELRDKAVALFKATFDEKPSIFAYAPGRVNFIGEHTDYCDGFVCPLAIHLGTAVVGRAVPGTVLVQLVI